MSTSESAFFSWSRCLAHLSLLFLLLPVVQAQTVDYAERQTEIQSRIQTVEANAGLGEDTRQKSLDSLAKALEEYRNAERLQQEWQALREQLDRAPTRIQELKRQLQADVSPESDGALQDVDELMARMHDLEMQLSEAREHLRQREKALVEAGALGTSQTAILSQRREALRSLEQSGAEPVDEPEVLSDARQAYRRARQERLGQEIRKAEYQISHQDQLLELANLERDAAASRVAALDARLEKLVRQLDSQRVRQAREAVAQARSLEADTAGLPPAVAEVAEQTAALREELASLTARSSDAARQLRSTERHLEELDADLLAVRERLENTGPTDAVGRLLRRSLKSAQRVQAEKVRPRELDEEIVRATDRRIDLSEQRRLLTDSQWLVDEMLAGLDEPGEAAQAVSDPVLRARTQALITAKREAIDALHQAYGRYLTELSSLEMADSKLSESIATMIQLVRREHLWIRSLPPLALSDAQHLPAALAQILDAKVWRQAADDALAGFAARPLWAGASVLLVLSLLLLRVPAQAQLAVLARRTGSIRTDRFAWTLGSLGLTLLLVASLPVLVALIGKLMMTAPGAAAFSQSLGQSLVMVVAQLLIIFTGTRWVVHPDGLARRHFGWPAAVCQSLHQELRWLMLLAIVCAFVSVLAEQLANEALRLALGRPATMLFSLALLRFLWRLLRPSSAIMQHIRQHQSDSLAARSWKIWFPAVLALPLINFLATAAGYQYTSSVATGLLIKTGWLILIVMVLRGIMLRWFSVSERRLRFERVMEQRAEARADRAKRQEEGEEHPAQSSEAAEVEVPEVDYRELGAQGRALVQMVVLVGAALSLWTLWSDLLPALDVLEQMTLPWQQEEVVDGISRSVPVTVSDVAVAILVLAASIFAAKNLSGLLSFTLLRRVAGDTGAQYAIITLCQYVLVGGGLLFALSGIGVQWSKLQWLVAALGVGLGFGLQEIVANFVSGIILLLERPVRVGDIITVGDASGTVARIRIRATTIVDWDRKELVVPNKEFVTGRLLNWTLSNDLLRLIVPVGIAYGDDPRQARGLLLEAAAEHEHVLDDPAPIVLFNSFGDNALGLELRVYLPSINYLLSTQTDLHDAIYEKFRQAGISIAFPQRDIHLDTSSPLDIRLHRGDRRSSAPPDVQDSTKPLRD